MITAALCKSSGKIMKLSNPKWHPETKRDATKGGQSY
jgi:hypothetical protein